MILIIDNYDSFVYNLAQYFGEISGKELQVYRNDNITMDKITKLNPDAIILSPGPGHPANKRDFGICEKILARYSEPDGQDTGLKTQNIKILGVCLGHQGIIHHFGGEVTKNKPMHGKTSVIEHNGKGIFAGVRSPLRVMRYHSLVGSRIPDCLEVTARSDDNVTMAVMHKTLPIYGVQFHPESIMTEDGKRILRNFLEMEV
jgi:anthranilate synthase/aminodeoxychorismate synthase-like glutamine amidotransferase